MANDGKEQREAPSCECGGGACCSSSGKWLWVVLILAVAGVLAAKFFLKKDTASPPPQTANVATTQGGTTNPPVELAGTKSRQLPRLVDFGGSSCYTCQMMTPVLSELRSNCLGRLDVQFVNIWENAGEGKKHGVKIIPTQIFFDADGKELFRHEGFYSKDAILAKWKELGIDLGQ